MVNIKRYRHLALCYLLLLAWTTPVALAADANWLIDFEAAKKLATQQQKDLFIDFTGSDWCPPCIALHKRVLSQPDFAKQLGQHYVFVTLDYPNDKSKQSPQTIQQNERLKTLYKIRGFPTIILANANGKSYDTQVGYSGDRLDKYIQRILDLKGKRDGKTYKIDQSNKPEMTAEQKAFDELSKFVNLKQVRHLIFCQGSAEGVKLIDQFLVQYPQSKQRATVTYLKAISLWNMGSYEQAAPAYEAFLKKYPKHDLANLSTTRLVQSYVRSDNPQQAVRAIEAHPQQRNGGIVLEWAQALSMLDRSEEGLKYLEGYIAEAELSGRLNREVGFLKGQLAQLQMIGQPLPDFEITNHRTQQTITPASLEGKVVLVDFWATWCRPCLAELPRLQKLYQQYHPHGFEILGISLDTDKEALNKMLEARKIDWPQFFDGNGWKNKLAVQLDVHRIPFCVLVDAEGTVRYVNLRGPAIERLVKKLVESNSGPVESSETSQSVAEQVQEESERDDRRRRGFLRRGRRGNQDSQR